MSLGLEDSSSRFATGNSVRVFTDMLLFLFLPFLRYSGSYSAVPDHTLSLPHSAASVEILYVKISDSYCVLFLKIK